MLYLLLYLCTGLQQPAETQLEVQTDITAGLKIAAKDTLNIGDVSDAKARKALNKLKWKPSTFQVHFESSPQPRATLVRFPSARPGSNATNNLVAMEWYRPLYTDTQPKPKFAPAVVVVHETGSRMTIGRLFARHFSNQGFHVFMIQLPWYGDRLEKGKRRNDLVALQSFPQAIADVRRARDAVAALPGIDTKRIALQGTSLGGIVAATAGALDDGYDKVFLLLAGGDLVDVIKRGKRDSAKIRRVLEKAGVTDAVMKQWIEPIEPLTLAHRLDRKNTWMFNGAYDTVIPPENSNRLAKAIGLEKDHYVVMPANHYSGILLLPVIVQQISDRIRD